MMRPTLPRPSEPLPGQAPTWLSVLALITMAVGVALWVWALATVFPSG